MYFQSFFALFQHYFAVLRTAWQLERVASYKHELAFLPAALELQETPPSRSLDTVDLNQLFRTCADLGLPRAD